MPRLSSEWSLQDGQLFETKGSQLSRRERQTLIEYQKLKVRHERDRSGNGSNTSKKSRSRLKRLAKLHGRIQRMFQQAGKLAAAVCLPRL